MRSISLTHFDSFFGLLDALALSFLLVLADLGDEGVDDDATASRRDLLDALSWLFERFSGFGDDFADLTGKTGLAVMLVAVFLLGICFFEKKRLNLGVLSGLFSSVAALHGPSVVATTAFGSSGAPLPGNRSSSLRNQYTR